ncbi:Rap1a/Tai family immunity protein [Paracoccus actinidiae]|uniref:Rap1a/Tai family immunity protein n=1 Tax=Paracoccus actinidiae TaxID=3064531 RepID=UPI00359C8CA7
MRWASIAVALLAVSSAYAQELSGNTLYEQCISPKGQGFCYGFVTGVRMGIQAGTAYSLTTLGHADERNVVDLTYRATGYCAPVSGGTFFQLMDVVVDYLARNPQERHEPAFSLVHSALREAFPCSH